MATAATPDMEAGAGGASAEPVSAKDGTRLVSLDFIRGIAVLGILFANITAFGHPFMVYIWPEAMPGGATLGDKLVWLFQYVVIDHKMRGLFTLLFGAGMMLFMERAWARGSTRWLQFRRLLWLLLFGMIHYYLIWFGDILQLYAVWGIVALTTMKWKAKTQLVVSLVLYVLGTVAFTGLMGSQYYFAENPQVAAQFLDEEQLEQLANVESETLEEVAETVERYQTQSYAGFVTHQVLEETDQNLVGLAFGLFETIGMILMGMALYRFGFFSGAFDSAKMRKWGWIGLLGGAGTSAALGLWVYVADFPLMLTFFVFQGLMMLPRLAFVLGLAALLVEWAPRASESWLGQRFIAAGRMAFSNYLGTSIVMLFLFHGWALGLFGQLHRIELFGIVLASWTVMLLWSKAWLERFRYGPLEWLWRCLTYWRLFPFKR
ncbi:DUF418 domain-containing protein [Parerythrobacter aestuarii]|uniref:DUF418 domain-containing protein n=1 Tax=Parerythrobacter aestuarii TaxID=3020909 RepID=UPI0024DE1526|nr:DUF418 domain-containing protein [Parerythrobacter aestuarii]